MSKTIINEDRRVLERLTNDEFFKILQHLSLEQCVLTQVFIPKKKWTPLLEANLQTLQAKCFACNKHVGFEYVKYHIKENDHLMLLRSNVKQFYHPFFTYGKIDIKLARGQETSYELRGNALRDLNMHIKNFQKECIFAKQVSDAAERRLREIGEERLIDIHLSKKIFSPDEIIVLVTLPLENISKLLFCGVKHEWQTVFSYKNLTKKASFYCKICSVNCCGIESLNSHLYGHAHNLRQLELYALCYEYSSKVNKNCCIQFGNSFFLTIKDCENNSHRIREQAEYDSWISTLPNELAIKFKLLNERAVKMFQCSENSVHQDYTKRDYENAESFVSIDNLGHLGVEYVLRIMKNENDRDPKFECGLCEVFGDANKLQRHILSFEHKKKYLNLHYCDTMKKYESLLNDMCYKDLLAVLREIVQKVAIEIENHHGRSLPYTVSLADYKIRRQELIAEVYALLHASQIRGPSFSNVVSREHIRYLKHSAKQLAADDTPKYPGYVLFTIPPKAKIYLHQMSHDPVIRLREYNAKFKTNRQLRSNRSTSPMRDHNVVKISNFTSDRFYTPAHDHRSRSRSPIHERSRTLQRISDDIFHSSNQDIWDIYRREIAHAANKIEIAYESFRKNPESHPLYEDEWNSFWQCRKKELECEGFDNRSYNFQPEWVQYFKHRIEVLFGEALRKSKVDIRYRLNIPLDAEEDCQRPAGEARHDNIAHQKSRSHKLREEIPEFERNARRRFPDFRCNELPNKRKEHFNSNKSKMVISEFIDNHSNVVQVLRLMTALEEHLGSLGGKIMDLLSNALQLEKHYSGNCKEFEVRILTSDNCNLLETAMEKLKSIVFAGLLDEKKLAGFHRAIANTTNLLKYAENMGWRQENNLLDKNDFFAIGKHRALHNQLYSIQSNIDGEFSTQGTRKALSDTLMDLVKVKQDSKQQNFGNRSKEYLKQPVCPLPPNIQEPAMNAKLFTGFKGQIPSSGLASFDTKLSIDEICRSRVGQRHFHLQTEMGQIQRQVISGGNNVYNNSFKSNDKIRTNLNSYTNNGTSRFLVSKTIPIVGQNN